ncbi:MAG: hypothetical protein KAS98_10260 [Deltaproteobacteria bacterium]|nr:hypothetical protein [Deltaproteobacteria bacterium]MCK5185934.1 hypothetical protein [Deltaproteobacteria bacterium]MCK5513227.1 hypothetical protein [Deltaproteobacteria bacterium]
MFGGFGTEAPLAPQTLPATWIVPEGTHDGENCSMTWSDIQPDSQPDPDNPYPG